MNKVLKFFIKTDWILNVWWILNHPILSIKKMEDPAGLIFGLVLSFWFLVGKPGGNSFPSYVTWIIAIASPFVSMFVYSAIPTRDEMEGLAPKRAATKIVGVFAIVMVIGTLGALFWAALRTGTNALLPFAPMIALLATIGTLALLDHFSSKISAMPVKTAKAVKTEKNGKKTYAVLYWLIFLIILAAAGFFAIPYIPAIIAYVGL